MHAVSVDYSPGLHFSGSFLGRRGSAPLALLAKILDTIEVLMPFSSFCCHVDNRMMEKFHLAGGVEGQTVALVTRSNVAIWRSWRSPKWPSFALGWSVGERAP